jgi:hypothetical protein
LSENEVLKKIFWTERNEASTKFKLLSNLELNDVYSFELSVMARVTKRWAVHVARMWKKSSACVVYFARLLRRRENGIKM